MGDGVGAWGVVLGGGPARWHDTGAGMVWVTMMVWLAWGAGFRFNGGHNFALHPRHFGFFIVMGYLFQVLHCEHFRFNDAMVV